MTTIQGSNGKRYEIRTRLYGRSNYVHDLYFGGIFLASTGSGGPNGESSTTMEDTLIRANQRVEALGIETE